MTFSGKRGKLRIMNNYPNIRPVIPLKGSVGKELAEYLDISYSMLYRIIKSHHKPGPGVRRRIKNRTGLPLSIWELETHEYTRLLYNCFRESQVAAGRATAQSAVTEAEKREDQRLIEITEIL